MPSRAISTSRGRAWTSTRPFRIANFNPNRIKVEVSSDGGNNFSPLTIADLNDATFTDDGNFMSENDTTPAITVSQGRLPAESGQAGDAGIPGGQVTVGWDDFAANQNQIMANTISAGRDYSFGAQYNGFQGEIPFFTYLTGGTAFPLPVSISNTNGLDSLEATVNIVDSSDADLGLELEAPSGDIYTLVLNQTIDTGGTSTVTITGQGFSGSNVGVVTYTNNNIASYAMGTTFADTATRDIFDPTTAGTNGNTAPFIGQFEPEAEGFGGFGGGGRVARRVPRARTCQQGGHQRHLASDHPGLEHQRLRPARITSSTGR